MNRIYYAERDTTLYERKYSQGVAKDTDMKWLDKFRTWLVERQAAKFAKELKEKNYEIRKPWNNGVWK